MVVPLMMAWMEMTSLAAKSLSRGDMMGVPPATLASNRTCTPFLRAIVRMSGPCRAITSLFAVTMCLPSETALRMKSRAGCWPPMTSTTMSTEGSPRMSSASVLSRREGMSADLGFSRSLTRTPLRVTGSPTILVSWSDLRARASATPPPTTPIPSRPTPTADLLKTAGLPQNPAGPVWASGVTRVVRVSWSIIHR